MYIAIAGNIGSGKSTLAYLLGGRLKWNTIADSEENPYIDDFYEDMRRWALNMQIYFLGMRMEQLSSLFASGQNGIIDRTIYEDAEVFACNLHGSGFMSSRDYHCYRQLYSFTAEHLPKPDLLIYLKANVPTLISQIQRRGRSYEASIDALYLEKLNELYEAWIAGYDGKVMVVDVYQDDFMTDEGARERILSQVEAMLKL